MKRKLGLVTALLALALTACSTTQVVKTHPLVVSSDATKHANVYFLREMPQRTRGVADDDLRIEIDNHVLLTLARGEYSLLRLKPGKVDLVVYSKTMLTNHPAPLEVWRARPFDFEAGKTYYIDMKAHQEEWRGFYFVPEAIREGEAKSMARTMTTAGQLAEKHPLYVPPPRGGRAN